MNTTLILSTFARWMTLVACRLRERRRLAREMEELSRLTPRELKDIGISHAQMAYEVRRDPCRA